MNIPLAIIWDVNGKNNSQEGRYKNACVIINASLFGAEQSRTNIRPFSKIGLEF
jgi:hypothetical protein